MEVDEDEFILYVKPLLLMTERRRSKECCVATFMKYFLMQYHPHYFDQYRSWNICSVPFVVKKRTL